MSHSCATGKARLICRPPRLRAADHLAGLGVASVMNELGDLRGLARACLPHQDSSLTLVNHVYEVVARLPYR